MPDFLRAAPKVVNGKVVDYVEVLCFKNEDAISNFKMTVAQNKAEYEAEELQKEVLKAHQEQEKEEMLINTINELSSQIKVLQEELKTLKTKVEIYTQETISTINETL